MNADGKELTWLCVIGVYPRSSAAKSPFFCNMPSNCAMGRCAVYWESLSRRGQTTGKAIGKLP